MGGDGGIIAMDALGNVSMTFNTSGMYRGRVGADGKPEVAIYRD
jgi:beta-aspartyl-peptidase (threonine type)